MSRSGIDRNMNAALFELVGIQIDFHMTDAVLTSPLKVLRPSWHSFRHVSFWCDIQVNSATRFCVLGRVNDYLLLTIYVEEE